MDCFATKRRLAMTGFGPITAAIGRYPHTEALFDDPLFRIEPYPVISRAFAPMVREQLFDLSEMAIGTFLMARAAGSDLVLLPVVLAARAQNGALLRRSGDAFGPGELAGRRVGVRAYSQTTALWLRGDLAETHGLRPEQVRWVTFEDAHVAGFRDPPWAERAAAGSDMVGMLRSGALDAAIFGAELPAGDDLVPVDPDPVAAGRAFVARHGFTPVNHMVVVRAAVARSADMGAIVARFAGPFPAGRAALDPAVAVALRFAGEQGLLAQALTMAEVWAGTA